MALWALGDMHLSFQTDKSMDMFGKVWVDHEKKIRRNCRRMIAPDDTFVITGDHSWGRKMDQCKEDLAFIEDLPGRKILLRGNHDMFWDAKKTATLNRLYSPGLNFLQNNYYTYQDYALVGSKGYTFEGPFWLLGHPMERTGGIYGSVKWQGRVWHYSAEDAAHADKLVAREAERLEKSYEAARAAGYRKFIMFLHYPPTNITEKESVFTQMAEDYGAEHVVYSHCHGKSRFGDSIRGRFHGIEYHLVSGDYLNFKPVKILE